MANPETVFQQQVLARHGSRPDLRLFRNETAGAWVGKVLERPDRGMVLLVHASMIQAGLCPGSSDVIGIMAPSGRFIAIELKVDEGKPEESQSKFVAMVLRMGGIAGICWTMDEVDALIGEPPE